MSLHKVEYTVEDETKTNEALALHLDQKTSQL